MPAAEPSAALTRDLLVLRNRAYLDPKRHYKTAREDRTGALPTFVARGTVYAGAAEGRAGRLTRAERRAGLLDAVMADERVKAYAARTTAAVHERATGGGVKAYKRKVEARTGREAGGSKKRRRE